MRKYITSGTLFGVLVFMGITLTGAFVFAENVALVLQESPSLFFDKLQDVVMGDWQKYGELFTTLQGGIFYTMFLVLIVAIPLTFAGHYAIIGAKKFAHDGPQVHFFGLFTRIIHFVAAISFTLLVITGLLIIFGGFFGGGTFIRTARFVHMGAALSFPVCAFFLFFIWVKDMLPKLYDISWMFMLGGYLSKANKPVPAGKFNAGQKMWFWLATLGGGIMTYTGYIIWSFGADLDMIRLYAIIHNFLGAALVAFYLTHFYMSVFAIAGSLQSMITGFKPKEEVDILHSRYKYK